MNNAEREEVVEKLAEAAHDAWWQQYVMEGYRSRKAAWGEEFMVPFEELSERGKDFDRLIMRAILKALDEQGYDVLERFKSDAPEAQAQPKFVEFLKHAIREEFGTFMSAEDSSWEIAAIGIVNKMGLRPVRFEVGDFEAVGMVWFRPKGMQN